MTSAGLGADSMFCTCCGAAPAGLSYSNKLRRLRHGVFGRIHIRMPADYFAFINICYIDLYASTPHELACLAHHLIYFDIVCWLIRLRLPLCLAVCCPCADRPVQIVSGPEMRQLSCVCQEIAILSELLGWLQQGHFKEVHLRFLHFNEHIRPCLCWC